MKRIELTQGKFALVDNVDFGWLNQWKWYAWTNRRGHWQARRWITIKKGVRLMVLMHRIILAAPEGLYVDHVNGSGLDNRRGNLRPCTPMENQQNQHRFRGISKYKGVVFTGKKWVARITVDRALKYLGTFDLEEDAAKAYDVAALKHFGEFAFINAAAPPESED